MPSPWFVLQILFFIFLHNVAYHNYRRKKIMISNRKIAKGRKRIFVDSRKEPKTNVPSIPRWVVCRLAVS